MSKKAELSQKHWKAINLIGEGKLSIKEIAAVVDLAENTLYKLQTGHEDSGQTGQLFLAEIKKIAQKQEKETKELFTENRTLALRVMNRVLRRHYSLDYTSDEDVKTVVSIYNALEKAAPSVSISNSAYSYVVGLTAEELLHEFNRLTSLAKGASVRRGVPKAGSRIAESVHDGSGAGSGPGEES